MKAVIRYYGRVLGPLGLELDALRGEVADVKDRPALVEYLKRMALPPVAAYAHVFVEDDEEPAFAVCDDGSIRDLVAGEWIVEPADDEE
ncbi:hypothetical protein [Mitsuokella multacida]|uniref:hypothetical protein n=1 Tax=Mitsuokella multacida TaxID=52226 RepID=UPI0026740F8E|nr:hypothetical protein [Mitsuokella multacida]